LPAAHVPAAVQCHDFEAALHHSGRVVGSCALGLDIQQSGDRRKETTAIGTSAKTIDA
jgi:hypothetical protein